MTSYPHLLLRPNIRELAAWMALGQNLAVPLGHRRLQTTGVLQGQWLSPYRGQGMQFEAVRGYSIGDELRHMDWKVTARTGNPHVKIFREERQQQVVVLVDDSPSMQFGTRNTFKNVQAARVAAMLLGSALSQHEKIGGGVFCSHEKKNTLQWIAPQNQRATALQILRPLTLAPEQKGETAGGFAELLQRLAGLSALKSTRSRLCILSDFAMLTAPLSASVQRALRSLRKQHQLTLIAIEDPADDRLPESGWIELRDVQGSSVALHSDHARLQATFRAYVQERRAALTAYAASLAIPLVAIPTHATTRDLCRLLQAVAR